CSEWLMIACSSMCCLRKIAAARKIFLMMRSTSCRSPSLPLTPLTLREVKAVKDVAQSSATESSTAIMKGVMRELSLTIFSQTPCTQSTNSDEGTHFKLNTVLVYI